MQTTVETVRKAKIANLTIFLVFSEKWLQFGHGVEGLHQ